MLKLITRRENLARNYDRDKATRSARELDQNYVAGIMTHNDPELRKILKTEYPTLIQAKRQELLNRRAIKKMNNEK